METPCLQLYDYINSWPEHVVTTLNGCAKKAVIDWIEKLEC